MGNIARFLASSSAMVVLSTGAAAAASSNISNTGPNSTNTITQTNTSKTVCINNNLITVNNSSNQSASSGSASSSSNTSGGSATSGSSSNSNSTKVTANVTNADSKGNCPKGTTAAPAGSPAAVAAAAGKGGLTFNSQGQLTNLPATGASDTLKGAAIVTAAVAGVAAISQVGLGAYRRRVLSS